MISFRQVTKQYPSGHTALEEVSFEIEAGEFVFLLGPSGSGKTTLLRLILREIVPTSGTIFVAEQDLSSLPNKEIPNLRRQIGSAFQDFKLIPDKSAYENVEIVLDILGKSTKESDFLTKELLKRVGLEDKMHLYPAQLSGGEIQRVAIARAVAANPVVLFADEPTGNLDPETSEQIVELLQQINEDGTTVIMATHDLNLATRFGHRRITVNRGKLTEDTKPKARSTKTNKDTEAEPKEEEKSAKKVADKGNEDESA